MRFIKSIDNRQWALFAFLVIWFIVKVAFYQYVGISNPFLFRNAAIFLAVLMLIVCSNDILNIKEHKLISWITIGFVITTVFSLINWGGSPLRVLQSSAGSLGLLYIVVYFVLRKYRVESKTIEYVMITLSAIYLLCWLYSLYKMPELVFGADRDEEYGQITQRGFYRTFIPGNVSSILSFYFLGRYLNERKKWALFLAFIMLIVVILHVGRQKIIWTIIVSAIMFYTYYRKHLFTLIFSAIIAYGGFIYLANEIPAVSAMMSMTEKQTDNFEDDIRMEAADYFLNDYPHNPITTIIGNGVPGEGSDLYMELIRAQLNGYYLEDLGFIGLYCNYGLFMVVLFLLLLWRVIHLKVEPKYEYFRYFIFFIYGTFLMSQSLTSCIFQMMLSYYALEQSAKRLEENNAYASIQQD